MDANEFSNLAELALDTLFEALDKAIGDQVEVDFDNGVLTLELEDGRQYILNKHAQNQEIWLSSPLSGAAHFCYDGEAKAWVSTRDGEALNPQISAEFSKISGKTVVL